MDDSSQTDTAHVAWDDRWRTEAGRGDWLEPEADVLATITRLRQEGFTRALDLGCGVGRHALAMAEAGFSVTALDASEAGIAELKRSAAAGRLGIEASIGKMTDLPYPDDAFDYLLAFNVIYHGDGEVVRRVIGEIARVLRPGGTYQGTMLSKRNSEFAQGREVAPNTIVQPDAVEGDKSHPHYYCNARELTELFAAFEPLCLVDREHARQGSWHWHLLAQLRPAP